MNDFYTEFDTETWGNSRNAEDHRSPFQIDRDRIVFSYAFRRLQSKTQVFQPGTYDFYRTRLTHSIEVARIGRSITEYLNQNDPQLDPQSHRIDPDLVEAIGLAHDLGHPPFGHAGERTLNQLMQSHGGFEGNAQTLRLLTQLIYTRSDHPTGMDPTRALLDGVMKYKATFSEWQQQEQHAPANHFIYDDQLAIRHFVLPPASTDSLSPQKINAIKSIECQIMDWADDTAYSLHDILDGIKTDFLSRENIEKWASQRQLEASQSQCLEALFHSYHKGNLEAFFARKVGEFIYGCRLVKNEHKPHPGQTHRHQYQLHIDPALKSECKLYKTIARELIFQSMPLHRLEHKNATILQQLFQLLLSNYQDGGPHSNLMALSQTPTPDTPLHRIIADTLSNLTDQTCQKLIEELLP